MSHPILHNRRQRISQEGALQLLIDLDEYRKTLDGPPQPYTKCEMPQELIMNLREAAFVFMVPGEDVIRVRFISCLC